jgi:hypothetical protein
LLTAFSNILLDVLVFSRLSGLIIYQYLFQHDNFVMFRRTFNWTTCDKSHTDLKLVLLLTAFSNILLDVLVFSRLSGLIIYQYLFQHDNFVMFSGTFNWTTCDKSHPDLKLVLLLTRSVCLIAFCRQAGKFRNDE